jgi:hypothetical protein
MRNKPNDAKEAMDLLLGKHEDNSGGKRNYLDAISILSLPKHLRKTAVTIHKVSKGDANSIANITGNDQKIEYNHLEELVKMGFLRKNSVNDETCYELI